MSVKIVVLDDGDTWSGSGSIYTVTDDAYEKLCNGGKIRHLDDAEIIDINDVNTREQ